MDPARQQYPLEHFLRDFIQDVVIATLNKKCFDTVEFRNSWHTNTGGSPFYEIPRLIFKTTAISLPSQNSEGLSVKASQNNLGPNPLEEIRLYPVGGLGTPISKSFPAAFLDFNRWKTTGSKSLVSRDNVREQTLKNSYHLSVFYVLSEDTYKLLGPPKNGETREKRDNKNGIYHLYLGRDRGLIKEVSFSKVDAPYLREARIQQKALNPLAQLAATYNVSLTMVGNTIFWPGQYIYVNPVGLGSGLKNPSTTGTVANQLGLGGYHLVTKVDSFVESGKFETKMTALFECSGDGSSDLPESSDAQGCQSGVPGKTTDITTPR